jgi:hypothetical protein
MKKIKLYAILGLAALATASVVSCSSSDANISVPQFQAGQEISSQDLAGSVKGTMTTGNTYYFNSPITINEGDTLVMQSGVKLLATAPDTNYCKRCVYFAWYTGKS